MCPTMVIFRGLPHCPDHDVLVSVPVHVGDCDTRIEVHGQHRRGIRDLRPVAVKRKQPQLDASIRYANDDLFATVVVDVRPRACPCCRRPRSRAQRGRPPQLPATAVHAELRWQTALHHDDLGPAADRGR